MNSIVAAFFRLPTPAIFAVSLALLVLVGVADLVTSYELTLSILYLAPIFLATWARGLSLGLAIAVLSGVMWSLCDIMSGHIYSDPFFRYWEGMIKLATFVLFAALLARLRSGLAAADQRFVTVLEGLSAAVIVTDFDSPEPLYLNQAFRTTFGASAPGQMDPAVLHGPHGEFARARLLPAEGPPSTMQSVEWQEPGGLRWFLLRGRALQWIDGRFVRLSLATDITQRKRAEELARQQQEKLQITSRLIAVGEMATTLAHELNQPLAAIANYNQGCVRRLRTGQWNPEDLLAAMEKGSLQAERAGLIIQRVREVARRHAPQRVHCDLNDSVRAMAGFIEPDADASGVQVTLDLAPWLPPVNADTLMIGQVLQNLAKNAIEAMQSIPPERRLLVIRSRLVVDNVEISVIDSGGGVPAELADNLFVPFFTTKPEGMGMGLHICRSIIEIHDGRLWCEPVALGGTAFRFTLPAGTPAKQALRA